MPSISPCLPACLSPCLPACLPLSLPACLPACMPSFSSLPACPHSLPAYPPSLPACLPVCPPSLPPACLPACPLSLPACPPSLPPCLAASFFLSRGGSRNFGKGACPHANAEGTDKNEKVFFCAEVAQKMKIRVSIKCFSCIWDQNSRSYC